MQRVIISKTILLTRPPTPPSPFGGKGLYRAPPDFEGLTLTILSMKPLAQTVYNTHYCHDMLCLKDNFF